MENIIVSGVIGVFVGVMVLLAGASYIKGGSA